MARRKRSASRRKRKGRLGRTIRAALVSAAVSFGLTTWALNPGFFDQLNLDHLSLEQLNLDEILASVGLAQPPAPVVASVDGTVQTTFAQCRHFFPGDAPIVPAGQALRELCFTAFAVLHSGQTKTPVFVAQRLNRQMLQAAKNVQRKDRFYEEARLPRAERAKLADYHGSGFDRGHMAPAGDMHNEDAMAQSFSLANMVPQNAQHNRGAWSKIEADTRQYVLRAQGDVYIFTGPVYKDGPSTIGDGGVAIPAYLYKVVYDATTGRSWVHWHENKASAKAGPPISYEEFVRRTALHLY